MKLFILTFCACLVALSIPANSQSVDEITTAKLNGFLQQGIQNVKVLRTAVEKTFKYNGKVKPIFADVLNEIEVKTPQLIADIKEVFSLFNSTIYRERFPSELEKVYSSFFSFVKILESINLKTDAVANYFGFSMLNGLLEKFASGCISKGYRLPQYTFANSSVPSFVNVKPASEDVKKQLDVAYSTFSYPANSVAGILDTISQKSPIVGTAIKGAIEGYITDYFGSNIGYLMEQIEPQNTLIYTEAVKDTYGNFTGVWETLKKSNKIAFSTLFDWFFSGLSQNSGKAMSRIVLKVKNTL